MSQLSKPPEQLSILLEDRPTSELQKSTHSVDRSENARRSDAVGENAVRENDILEGAEEIHNPSRLFLIDGSGYIFRAYFAIAPLSSRAGLPTNALLGFTRMIFKLLKQVSPEYLAITFDTPKPTFRHQMYSEYKANRAECPQDLIPQMPYFRKIARALRIPTLEQEGVEADDIIATLTRRFATQVDGVTIVSGDKDLCQLVDETVCVYDAMRDIIYDTPGVREKFGVKPEQIVDYLTLIGDSSDNVPGLKGVGPKTAAQLLEHYGSLDSLFAAPEQIEQIPGLRGAASVRKKFEESRESIDLSKQLVTLKYDVDLLEHEALDSLRYPGPDREVLEPLFRELDFTSMLKDLRFERPEKSAQPGQANESQGISPGSVVVDESRSYSIAKESDLPAIADALRTSGGFAFDTETTSLNAIKAELVGISLSWQPYQAVYIPVLSTPAPERTVSLDAIRRVLGPVFADESIPKYGLSLKYDLAVLRTHQIEVKNLSFDGMLASYVLSPDRRQHSLSALASRYFDETMLSYKELTGGKNIEEIDLEAVSVYACTDADTSYRLREAMLAAFDDASDPHTAIESEKPHTLRTVFERIEMPLIPVLENMERNGIKIDLLLLEQLSEEFQRDLLLLEEQIYEMAGERFNLNSPKQLSQILFEKLSLPTGGLKRTQSAVSTNASVLIKLAPRFPIVSQILEYRELFKLRSTYLESLKLLADPVTHRVHTSFNQAVAATGRLSSSDPNLQNIPIRNPRGRRIREAFIADEGSLLLSVDYSQIELRVLAHMSGDEALSAAFHRGDDIHLATARELLSVEGADEEQIRALRRVAKTINFGIVYGMSAFRLAQELEISRTDAQRYIERYFQRYPRVQGFFSALENQIDSKGYVETMFGHRRYLHELDTSGRDKGYAKRSLLNAPLQGSAAEIMKIAMIKVHKKLTNRTDARMVLQVHDELVVEVMESSVTEVQELVIREMEHAVKLSVPLRVDAAVSNRWE